MKCFNSLFVFTFFFSTIAHAQIQFKAKTLTIGSDVQVEVGSRKLDGLFMGRLAPTSDFSEQLLVMGKKTGKVLIFDGEEVKTRVPRAKMQKLIRTTDQSLETCAAYAIYHFWHQTHEIGLGNEELKKSFSTEPNRHKVLEQALAQYYIGRSLSLKTIIQKFGTRFGFKCAKKNFDTLKKARDYLYQKTSAATPVLIEFDLGKKMVKTPHVVEEFMSKIQKDPRLWIPRKVGERLGGGHAIVGAAGFIAGDRKKIVVLDSNWTEPRVWDLSNYISEKTDLSTLIFHSCEPNLMED